MSTDRQKNKRPITTAEIAEMRDMRAQGDGLEKIAAHFDRSLSVIHRHAGEVVTPKKIPKRQPASDRAVTAYERKQRAIDRNNSHLKPLPARTKASPEFDPYMYPFEFDPDAEFDTTGPLPDPELALHAQAILTQWVEGISRGRIFVTRPVSVTQASLIQLAGLPIWDYDAFLEDRTMWKVVRKLAGVSSTELAATTGISASSISRYEKGTRTPATGHLRILHETYTDLSERAHANAETLLVIDSYCDNETRRTGVPKEDITFDRAELLEWTASDFELEDFTIDHIEHLAAFRNWLPHPQWREPSTANLWLSGYPKVEGSQTP